MATASSAPSIVDTARKIPVRCVADIQASSETEGHPIVFAFDDGHGPGATQWRAANPGEQTVSWLSISRAPLNTSPWK